MKDINRDAILHWDWFGGGWQLRHTWMHQWQWQKERRDQGYVGQVQRGKGI